MSQLSLKTEYMKRFGHLNAGHNYIPILSSIVSYYDSSVLRETFEMSIDKPDWNSGKRIDFTRPKYSL
jgi:hypothetical protein